MAASTAARPFSMIAQPVKKGRNRTDPRSRTPVLPAMFWRLLLLEHRTVFLVRQNRCRNPFRMLAALCVYPLFALVANRRYSSRRRSLHQFLVAFCRDNLQCQFLRLCQLLHFPLPRISVHGLRRSAERRRWRRCGKLRFLPICRKVRQRCTIGSRHPAEQRGIRIIARSDVGKPAVMPCNGERRGSNACIIRDRRTCRGMVCPHSSAAKPPLKHIAVFADVVQHTRIRALRRRVKCCCKACGKRRNILQMLKERLSIRMCTVRAVCKISQWIAPPFCW